MKIFYCDDVDLEDDDVLDLDDLILKKKFHQTLHKGENLLRLLELSKGVYQLYELIRDKLKKVRLLS